MWLIRMVNSNIINNNSRMGLVLSLLFLLFGMCLPPFLHHGFQGIHAKARICNLKFCFNDVIKNDFAGVQSLVSYMWMSSQNRSSKTVKDKNNPYCHRINIWCNILAYFVLYVFEGAWSIWYSLEFLKYLKDLKVEKASMNIFV